MNELVLETIESYNNYIEILPRGCKKISDDFRNEQFQNGLNSIRDFSEGVSWIIEAAELLQKNEVTVRSDFVKIQDYLLEINEALENEDFILVADLFEYEIAPYFESYPRISISHES